MPTKVLSDDWLIEHGNAFLKELWKGSDRGAALIGCDYLDDLMKGFLKSRMNEAKTADPESKKKRLPAKLLEYPGALSTAASRADLAHALGWIGPKMYADIVAIRKIRNKFGHSHKALRFTDEVIGQLCCGLHSLRFVGPYRLKNNRGKFLMGVMFLSMQIIGLSKCSQKPGLGPEPPVNRVTSPAKKPS